MKLNVIIFVGLFFLLMSACDQSNKSISGTKVGNTIHSVRLGTTQTPPSWLMLIAEHNGYFEKQGLNVIITSFKSGKRALKGMFEDKVDISATADVPIVFNSLARQDFSIISNIGVSSNDNVIVARKDRGIQSQSDLKGKTIATQNASSAHFYLHLFLLSNKLSDKDIKQLFMKVEKLPQALVSAEVDAIATREPYFSEAVEKLGSNAIVFETPGLYLKSFGLVAFNSYIKNNPEIIYKIVNALLLAEQFVKDNNNQAIEILSLKLGITKDRVATTFQYLDLRVTLGQSLILRLEDEARWVTRNKLTDILVIPNYLDFIHAGALVKANPEAMTIIGIE